MIKNNLNTSKIKENPKQEYKREAFLLFGQLLDKVNYDVISLLSKFEVQMEQDLEQLEARRRQNMNMAQMEYKHAEVDLSQEDDVAVGEQVSIGASPQPFIRDVAKIGRNDPCPCQSGKKYKQCHGKLMG